MYREQVRNNKNNRNNTNGKSNGSNRINNNAQNKKPKKRNILSYELIKEELEEIKNRGINVYINGDPYNINELHKICLVLEENNYMKDFVSNDDGKIVEVHYDKIQ